MYSLPTLYRRTAKKKIEQWTITIDCHQFWTESGEVGGKITKSKPTTCSGKNVGRSNETTGREQAAAEALSKWTKKAKTGYFEDVSRVDEFYFVEAMLATPLHKVKGGIQFPCLFQIKYNGARMIHTAAGGFSREGELWETAPHVTEELQAVFAVEPTLVLDGELFCYENRAALNETMKLIRRKPEYFTEEDRVASKEQVVYVLYDCYSIGGLTQDAPYERRLELLDALLSAFHLQHCVIAPTTQCETQLEVGRLYQKALDEQHEGGIIRYPTNRYENGIRSKRIVKLKPSCSAEAVITKIEEGAGNWTGTGKIVHMDWEGVKFKASFKGGMIEGAEFLRDAAKWVGQTVTFEYLYLTPAGIPYSARLDYKNCLKH